MKDRRLIIGSRSSKLALIQAEFVKNEIEAAFSGLGIEIKTIKTTGDKILDVPLAKIGDKGLFTKEIEDALLKREIDIAVHSMKDLPTEIPGGLKIAAITKRENPCDVLISLKDFSIKTLPENSKVGTSSLRRRAQLLSMRSDLKILDLRGNLDTRIRKLEDGLFDAIVLAYAGIKRFGYMAVSGINISPIPINNILPPPGQGALGIEIRGEDLEVYDIIRILDDFDSHLSVKAERVLLSRLGGGCQVPIGIYAKAESEQITITAGVFSLDGKTAIKDEIAGGKENASLLSEELAGRLLAHGAKKILDEIL